MGLLSTDISKLRRLSIKEATLPSPDPRELDPPTQIQRPPTDEEITFTKLVERYPLLDKLVETFDLVSSRTGERIKKTDLTKFTE